MQVWLLTFSGSGNPHYSSYLLGLFCNFEWEFEEGLSSAIFMNWLMNTNGVADRLIEGDLMQEHFNFWLEDMGQHKGKNSTNHFPTKSYR